MSIHIHTSIDNINKFIGRYRQVSIHILYKQISIDRYLFLEQVYFIMLIGKLKKKKLLELVIVYVRFN
jgi:trehalose-6-phosphate synthase